MLHAAADAGVERVVLASSSEVYGDGQPPYAEEHGAAPRTGYAAAKLVEEKLAEAVTLERGIATTSLRYFNVYGVGQEASAYGFVTAIFCDRARAGLPPVIFGDGTQTRDFTFVEDTVRGTILAAEHASGHQVLNLGTGVETSIAHLARTVLTAAGHDRIEPVHAEARADEVRRRVADERPPARRWAGNRAWDSKKDWRGRFRRRARPTRTRPPCPPEWARGPRRRRSSRACARPRASARAQGRARGT